MFIKRILVACMVILLLVVTGCSDTSNDTDSKEEVSAKSEQSAVEEEKDIQDIMDYNYVEVSFLMQDVMLLATKIKSVEVSIDSDYSKQKMAKLYEQIMPLFEESKKEIIPNLEQNNANNLYSDYIYITESMVISLKKAIDNRDFPTYGEFDDNVPKMLKILKSIELERELQN